MKPRYETPKPRGIVGTYGTSVASWADRVLGIRLGQWQSYVLDGMLRHDSNGNLIHRIALLSTGRQNGKSVVVRSFIGWMLDEGHALPAFSGWTTILAAAHDAKQARIVYRGVAGDFEGNDRLRAAARITGYRGIELGGLLFDVVTAQPGSARGLSAGAIAWDEVVTQKDHDMWEALSPTQSAQRNPLMILTSTAGHEDSVLLRGFYDRLVRMSSGDEKPDRTFYGAWWQSEDIDAQLDWRQIRQANPALKDGRLSRQAIVTEHGLLPADSWRRERLNHFVDSRTANAAFKPGVWAACRLKEPLGSVEPPFALGIGVSPGWERASIAVAGVRPDGRIGVEIHRDFRDGVTPAQVTAAVNAFSVERWPQAIAFDASSGGAGEFTRAGEETGQPYDGLKPSAMVSATMDVSEMIMAGRLAVDDPLLDYQIGMVVKRPVGADGAFRFGRSASLGPIDAIEAMALAAHAIAYRGSKPNIW